MFAYADKDGDGKLSYSEFSQMINPPKPPTEAQNYRKPGVKRVTIQTTEPEKLSVTNFINTGKEPNATTMNGYGSFISSENLINIESFHETPVDPDDNEDQLIDNSWNIENPQVRLLDY